MLSNVMFLGFLYNCSIGQPQNHMSHSLNSLKGGYIGDYYRGLL